MRRIARAPQNSCSSDEIQPLDGSSGRSGYSSSNRGGGGTTPVVSPTPNRSIINHNNNNNNRILLGTLPSVPIGYDEIDDHIGGSNNSGCLDHNLIIGSGGGGGGGRRRGGGGAKSHHRWIKIAFLVVLLSGLYLVFQYYERQHDIQLRLALERDEFQPMTEDLLDKLQGVKEQRAALQKQIDAESIELAQLRKRTTEDIPTLQKQIADLKATSKAYKDRMHAAIQHLSRKRLLEKFGPGPYYVVLDLSFDPLANVPGDQHFIAIELASADEMPHSIYTFLEQVSNNLYDGTSFHRNAGHIVQCGPAINFLSAPGLDLLRRFKDSGFAHVLFPEYSPNYPHNKYTVGFGGTGAVGEWYINIRDNRLLHGPGGQRNRPDPEEADPCFGRVIDGFETVNRLHKSPTVDGLQRSMEHNVAVTKVTWMTQTNFDEWKKGQKGDGR